MSGLAELERAKRRRLQEAYADLRPGGKNDDDRQAKLRNLLMGAAADAGLSAGLQSAAATRNVASSSSGAAAGSPAVRALAAAAAASIAAVEGGTTLRGKNATAAGHNPTGICLGPGARTGPAHGQAHIASPRNDGGGSGRRRCPDAAAARPPPPGPMDGGFLPEADPIARLSRLPMPAGAAVGAVGPIATAAASSSAAAGGAPVPGASSFISGLRGRGTGAARMGATPPASNGVVATAAEAGTASATAQLYDTYEDDEGDAEAELPSDVELALMALKSDLRSHAASADLPPLVLRSQLACLLEDRSTVERQLDEQRLANRVRVFKLPTGADEFGILTSSDYRAIVRQAADDASAASAAAVQPPQPQQASGAYGTPAGVRHVGSRWHAAAEAFLFRVVDRFTDFELSRDHMLQLLRTAPSQPPTGSTQPPQPPQPLRGAGRTAGRVASAGEASGPHPAPPLEDLEEQMSLLLHLGCIARHTDGDADAFVLAVPGAGKLVKAVLGGRRELMTWLAKRQHREAPEEQIHKLKLRSSCLPSSYHVKDLVGRGAARRVFSTCGPMIKLPQARKAAG